MKERTVVYDPPNRGEKLTALQVVCGRVVDERCGTVVLEEAGERGGRSDYKRMFMVGDEVASSSLPKEKSPKDWEDLRNWNTLGEVVEVAKLDEEHSREEIYNNE